MLGDAAPKADKLATTITANDLMPLRECLRIVHHVPGRLRVRLTRIALRANSDFSLAEFVRFVEVTCDARVAISAAALSAVLEYDPERLPPRLWDDLIDGPEAAARSAFETLTTAP